MFSIKDSVVEAYKNSPEKELIAIVYLSVCGDKKLSKKYLKSLKKLGKYQKKIEKLIKTGRDNYNSEVLGKNKILKKYVEIQKKCIEEAKNKAEINNTDLISSRIVKEYKQGFGLLDSLRGIRTKNSSYGRVVYNLLEKISSDSMIKKIKRMRKKEKSFMQKLKSEKPEVKDKTYLYSKEGGEYIELQFMIYYLDRFTADYSSDEKNKLIEDLVKEIAQDNSEEKERLLKMFKSGQLGKSISKIVLQIIRLSVGKGVFMNTAVRVTNIVLRLIIGKGMSYGRNAVFRQAVAKYLGSGGETPTPWTIAVAILLSIPDLIAILNPRNYLGLTNTIIILYLLRDKNLIS